MDTKNVGSFFPEQAGQSDSWPHTLCRRQLRITEQVSNHRFSGDPDDDRLSEFSKASDLSYQIHVMLDALAKAISWINGDMGFINAVADEFIPASAKKIQHLANNVLIVRIELHRLRDSAHMHQDYPAARFAQNFDHLPVSPERRDVVDDIRTCCQSLPSSLRFVGIDRQEKVRKSGTNSLDDRNDTPKFFLQSHGIRTGPRRFATDIQDCCPFLDHSLGMSKGGFLINELTSIGKRIGRDIQDAHYKARTAQVNRALSELPDHGAHSLRKLPIGKCFRARYEKPDGYRTAKGLTDLSRAIRSSLGGGRK